MSTEYKLHPLVICSVSDHHTRVAACQGRPSAPPPRVFGCLLGEQHGRVVEICNSFELEYATAEDGTVTINKDFLATRTEQYKRTFPTYEVLGWYSTGADAVEGDLALHKTFMEINESPVYMLLDPRVNVARKGLPVTLYESEVQVVGGDARDAQMALAPRGYTIETVEAERIAVDQSVKIAAAGSATNYTQLVSHLSGMHSAVKMLRSRVAMLYELLEGMRDGRIPFDHSLARQCSSLVNRLPTIDSERFHADAVKEYNDTLLIAYLAAITKGTDAASELVDKLAVAHGGHQRRRAYL